ncbi:tellurite resistance TerB family protein [Stappia taiwanensis]|uniref:Tellurite resistance TerB family protein n=1 Tax=Stappia taiwanensis TaxID=992267 RepID=A0A838Y4M5_9HYPH|nr:tellurite resistance TerB family protein [Stappia taiwanensis]MBA4613903.1 tellurite resistance TerB family protein [Stappia taiwanensis]GGF07699.1 protein YebE [Stappia taiwanensis]
MFDAKKLLDGFLGNAAGGAQQGTSGGDMMARGQDYLRSNAGGLAGGALAGGLAGLLLGTKGGRKLGKKAVTYGGMALVAGLAYKAYRDWQGNRDAPGPAGASAPAGGMATGESAVLPPPAESPFAPEHQPGGDRAFALVLLTAMISAAKADGHIDGQEQRRIFDKLDSLELDTEAKAFVMDELRAPLDLDRVVAGASTQEAALEIFAASRLAIDPDHPAEKAYLDLLAARLGLDAGLVAEIDRAVREAEA